jgi:hypothetical protein
LPDELDEAMQMNNMFKQIMMVPDKIINARKINGYNTISRYPHYAT